MLVRTVMKTDFLSAQEDISYREAAEILIHSHRGCLFVLNQAGALVGVVSEHDLFRVLYPFYGSYYLNPELYTDAEEREGKIDEIQNHPIKSFMTKQVIHTESDWPVMKAGALMLAKNVRRLPVLEQGKLVGVITRREVYRELCKQHLGIETV
jgi:CBS domain-containing protein